MRQNEDAHEAARAAQLRETIAKLRPQVDAGQKRDSERARRVRAATGELFSQAAAQALGSLIAAAALYLVATAVGALQGTKPLTLISAGILLAGFCASAYSARWFFLPSKRTELKLMSATTELLGIEVRSKILRGDPLTVEEAKLVATGIVRLEGLDGSLLSSQEQ